MVTKPRSSKSLAHGKADPDREGRNTDREVHGRENYYRVLIDERPMMGIPC